MTDAKEHNHEDGLREKLISFNASPKWFGNGRTKEDWWKFNADKRSMLLKDVEAFAQDYAHQQVLAARINELERLKYDNYQIPRFTWHDIQDRLATLTKDKGAKT